MRLREVVEIVNTTATEIRPGVWVPSRPLPNPFWRHRLRHAWDVLTGKADALYWPESEAADG